MRPIKKISDRVFVLILGKHRLWGSIFLPWFIEKEEGNDYYSPVECLSPYASPDSLNELTELQIELIQLINSYTDRHLFRLFSRERTVVEFTEKISEERFEKHIKPYIERKLIKCFDIIRRSSVPVYRQKTGTSNLHEDDLMHIGVNDMQPLFTFEKGEELSTYSLELFKNEKKVDLRNDNIEIISNYPCLLRHDDELSLVRGLEGSKLTPFLKKDKIIIPASHTKKYFSSFVKNIINNYEVVPAGFDILTVQPAKSAILVFEKNIRNIPALILRFRYEEEEIYYSSTLNSFTLFMEDNDYTFKKIYRDKVWEEYYINILNELGFYSEDNINFTVTSRTGERHEELYSLIEWINESYDELISKGFRLERGSLDKKYNLRPFELEIDYEVINDWFDLKAAVKINGREIPFTRFRENIINNNREFIDDDGSVLILPVEWFSRYRELFEFGKTKQNRLKVHKQHFALLNDVFNEQECRSCPALEKLVIPEKIPDTKIPAGLNARLRDYQKEGLRWLVFLQENNLGGCLADDMGLGKTIQTLALLQYNREMHNKKDTGQKAEDQLLPPSAIKRKTSLLIVPASLIYNWENEINKFTPSLKTYSYRGNQRKKSTRYFSGYDIILSSYHTIRQDIDLVSEFDFHYIILDESQLIKNPASQLYKAISRLRSAHKLVLSGTPVENSLTDLWTQLNFVNTGLLGNLSYFKREFTSPIEKDRSVEKEERLAKLIRPFILRRTKEEVAADLPPVMENTVYCDMTEDQNKKYEEEKSIVRNSILENALKIGEEKSALIILQGLMKLRQISNHPVLADPDYISDSGKFENVMHDIDAVITEGHKILVFSSFVRHLDLFAREFDARSLKYSMLTGSSSNRGKIVEDFKKDRDKNIFLISLKAGGVGLNLTAADYVFILDPWWNPSAELQALSRAHRIGQDKNVFVKRYISTNSIEEKIVRLQKKKSGLAETFISTNNPLKEIPVKDILELIG